MRFDGEPRDEGTMVPLGKDVVELDGPLVSALCERRWYMDGRASARPASAGESSWSKPLENCCSQRRPRASESWRSWLAASARETAVLSLCFRFAFQVALLE
jgi:hypothetical protein